MTRRSDGSVGINTNNSSINKNDSSVALDVSGATTASGAIIGAH